MKNIVFIFVLALLSHGCAERYNTGTEFMFSGKVYKDCSKSFVYKNAPLEVVLKNQGLGGQKDVVLTTATTDAEGYFSLTFKMSGQEEIALRIPANDAIQLFSPINVQEFNSENIREEVKNLVNHDFYLYPVTSVKVRLNCGKVYTDQDTLYINEPFAYDAPNEPTIHKIVKPQTNMVLPEWKYGQPKFGRSGAKYGIGWEDYKKSSSGLSGTAEYNILWFTYPPCDKSPMEVVLNLP